eukprot:m.309168 g.309168  ORF g.309168 m.309168 type:complete len:115 (-) comp15945_c0_seq5:2667-3011(-)
MHSLGATVSEDLAATSTDAAADTSPTRQTSHPSCAKANASRSESIPTCMQSDVTSTDYPMVHQTTLASTLALCATTLESMTSYLTRALVCLIDIALRCALSSYQQHVTNVSNND